MNQLTTSTLLPGGKYKTRLVLDFYTSLDHSILENKILKVKRHNLTRFSLTPCYG